MPSTKKRLGQHWLNDAISLGAIAEAAKLEDSDHVLEVGPGLGTLTKLLVDKAQSVTAVELDDDLIDNLEQLFNGQSVSIVHESILKFDLDQLPASYKVVANIPYYLTSQLIRRLLETNNKPSLIVLLVQKEVAQRIAAKPGDMSILSVSVQFYAEVDLLDVITRDKFIPPPEVDSQVVRIKPTSKPKLDVDELKFFRLVKAGFGERRKKLRSSLAGGLQLDKNQVDELLKAASIADSARAQDLTLEDWFSLYQQLYNQ